MTKSSVGKTLFGIELGSRCLKGIVLQRKGDQIQIRQSFQVPLTLDPLTGDPELVGHEIRNHLNKTGVHENRCILCVPLKWAMFLQTELPKLSEADTLDYIKVQAEHEFPFSPDDLTLSTSKYQLADGLEYATIAAIPTSHLNQLQKVFKAARLRTTSITFGITSLLENINTEEKNSVAIYVDESVVEMKIMLGGGVAALRSIEDTSQVNMEEREFDSTSIANQIRISLGQLPISSRNLIHSVRIFGLPSLVEDLKDAIQSAVERMGMTVETGTIHANKQIIDPEDTGDLYQPALYTAVKGLFDQKYDFEFSIPQTSRLKQITAVISSQRIAWPEAAPLD